MPVVIEAPEDEGALTEFVLFQNDVHAGRGAGWPANMPLLLPILQGESPYCADREIRPLVARGEGRLLARAAAVLDHRYMQHWKEKLGHIVFFEAMPESGEAARALLDEACSWLAEKGMPAARLGFGLLDFPFTIDAYEKLPPSLLRHNPAYYHVLIKSAGFETEKGMVDYKIRVTPEVQARWERALEAGRRTGFEILPLGEVPEERRAHDYTRCWNDAFKAHWGFTPIAEEETLYLFRLLEPFGLFETSVIAYEGDEPVGFLFVYPDLKEMVMLAPDRALGDDEMMNVLGIGVREPARGRGLNYAMAAHAFLELARRGRRYVSYTLVLDDNWPSRRTALGLGAELCANYVVYRRNFGR